jgi:hypothetical protein
MDAYLQTPKRITVSGLTSQNRLRKIRWLTILLIVLGNPRQGVAYL